MHLYHLTLSQPTAYLDAVVGNFSGQKIQEILCAKGTHLELLRPDPATGRVQSLCSTQVFGTVRSMSPFRLPGSSQDFIAIGSDSGRIAILEYVPSKNAFEKLHLETYGKSGARRIVPGQYLAADPKGRAIMIGALEKQKFVYVLNRDQTSKLTISSPLEAHKSHTVCFDMIGLDVGFENPAFACIEMDYSEADQDPTGEAFQETLKTVTIYELDLGLNHVVRKWSDAVDRSAHKLISVPGGNDGPSGVLVCSENYITWMHPDYSPVRMRIPRRADIYGQFHAIGTPNGTLVNSEDPPGSMIVASVVHKLKKGFFILIQNEQGDLFKMTFDYSAASDGMMGGVDNIRIKYFDTVPPASSLILLKTGFLFVGCEFGNHTLYQIESLGDDDDEQMEFSAADIPDEETDVVLEFYPRELRNIVPVDEISSLSPILGVQIANLTNEESPQQYALCGRGSRSSFRILRHGLEVSEMAVSELPGNPNAVWTVKATAEDEHDAFIVVSFVNATLVLSIGETVEEVMDTGFLSTTPTLTVAQMGEDALVQIYPQGIRHIRADRRVSEWRAPGNRVIEKATCNRRQVVISLSGGELVYFELDTAGQLNEYQDRKEMTANVLTLCLGPIPAGRQRSRFLAVGCADNTVRIISLDPDSCMQSLSMQAITATPESLAITNSIDPATGVSTLYLNIGLQNGLFLKTILDSVTGVLSDSRLRFLGSRPTKLFKVQVNGGDAVLALSSRPWLSFYHNGRNKLLPLSYVQLESASSFSTEQCREGMVAIAGNTLRILSVDKLDTVFNQTTIPLQYTPRKQVLHPNSRFFIVIESDNNTFSTKERARRFKMVSNQMDTSEMNGELQELPTEQFGLPQAGPSYWGSCVRVLNPVDGSTIDIQDMDDNEAAFSITTCKFKTHPGQHFLVIGTAKDLQVLTGKCSKAYLRTYQISNQGALSFLHKTEVEELPRAVTGFFGKVLVGMGTHLRLYELGKKKLLRKCEFSQFPNCIVDFQVQGYRVLVSDIKESIHYTAYRPSDNRFIIFADDSTPRWMTCSTMVDYNTVAGGDKFGNIFVNRIPSETSEEIDEDPTGTRMIYKRGYLHGAAFKADHLIEFHVGDMVTSISKTAMIPGGREILMYATLHGGVGMFIPFVSKDDVELFTTIEMSMRSELPPICGRDHMMYRSSYFPVKNVLDGDICELFNTLPNEKKRQIAESVDRSVPELAKKLEDVRNRVAF